MDSPHAWAHHAPSPAEDLSEASVTESSVVLPPTPSGPAPSVPVHRVQPGKRQALTPDAGISCIDEHQCLQHFGLTAAASSASRKGRRGRQLGAEVRSLELDLDLFEVPA